MWKYCTVWLVNAGMIVYATIADPSNKVAAAAAEDPISAGYSGAQLISQLTDRGLWLFFLFIILGYSYWDGRRKDQEIGRLQKKQEEREVQFTKNQEEYVSTLAYVEKLLERVERKLNDQ